MSEQTNEQAYCKRLHYFVEIDDAHRQRYFSITQNEENPKHEKRMRKQ